MLVAHELVLEGEKQVCAFFQAPDNSHRAAIASWQYAANASEGNAQSFR